MSLYFEANTSLRKLALFMLSIPSAYAADCARIQELIDAAPAGKAVVRVPAGDYVCQGPIIIQRSDISVEGAGVNLKLADNANAPVMIIGSPHTKYIKHPVTGKEDFYTVAAPGSSQIKTVRNVQVSGFRIDGNKDKQNFECWTPNSTAPIRSPGEGISNKTCGDDGPSALRNNGLTLRGVEDVLISDLVLDNNTSGGVVTEKHIKRMSAKGIKARNNYFDGFAGYQTEDSVIEDSEFTNNAGAGASLDLFFNNNTFRRTKFNDNGHQGVFARELTGNTWIDSEISCNGFHGVFLASTHGAEIDTGIFRVKAREAGHSVGPDLKIPLVYFDELVAAEEKNPTGDVPLEELRKRAIKYKKPLGLIFQEMYEGNMRLKKARCANDNAFVRTKISCSGTVNPEWGAGIRINDDECSGNCIDSGTARMMNDLKGSDANRAGDITRGTLGAINPDQMIACGRVYLLPFTQKE
jgi:hypothetical protein